MMERMDGGAQLICRWQDIWPSTKKICHTSCLTLKYPPLDIHTVKICFYDHLRLECTPLKKPKQNIYPFMYKPEVFCIVLMMLYFSGILCKSRAVLCFILNVTKSHSQFPKSHHQLQHNSWCWMCQYNSRHSKVCVCSSHILSDSTYTWWQYSDLSIYIFKYLLCYYITLAFYFALCHLFYLSHFMSF